MKDWEKAVACTVFLCTSYFLTLSYQEFKNDKETNQKLDKIIKELKDERTRTNKSH